MPLYCAGLWEAVNIAPGASRRAGGEVHEVGGGQAEVDDVDPLGRDALGEGRRQLHPGRSHVAGDEDLLHGALLVEGEAGERRTDRPRRAASSWSGTVPRTS